MHAFIYSLHLHLLVFCHWLLLLWVIIVKCITDSGLCVYVHTVLLIWSNFEVDTALERLNSSYLNQP